MCDCEELEYEDFATLLKEIKTAETERPPARVAPMTVSVRRKQA